MVVFDVLGDVVCGGFAAPLRASFADKVLIVEDDPAMAVALRDDEFGSTEQLTGQVEFDVTAGYVLTIKTPGGGGFGESGAPGEVALPQ